MKRRIGILLVIMISAFLLVGAVAEDIHDNGEFIYEVKKNGTATIVGYSGRSKDIILPNLIDGYTITAIGDEAFKDIGGSKRVVTLPETITSIGEKAFWGARVESINIPDSVEYIGYGAFAQGATAFRINPNHPRYAVIDSALYNKENKELLFWPDPHPKFGIKAIPEGISAIGDYALYEVDNPPTLPETLEKIGNYAFTHSRLNQKYEIPASVSSMGIGAFKDCWHSEWSSIYISPDSLLTEIPDDAFNISKNVCIYFPVQVMSNLKKVGNHAFSNIMFMKVSSYSLASLVELGEYAFSNIDVGGGVSSFSFSISGTCKTIPKGVFEDASVKGIGLGNGIEDIESNAFAVKLSIKEIVLPASLKNIKADAFSRNTVFTVEKGSYAERWANENAMLYNIIGEEANLDWLTQ